MLRIIPGCSREPRRVAFTLIELLIVLAIIALLSSLGTGAYFRIMLTQQQNTTKATLSKVQSVLHKQWSALADLARKEPIDQGFSNAYGGDSDACLANWMLARQQQTFPRSFMEVFNPPQNMPVHESYRTYLAQYGVTSASVTPAPYESSACLLMALQYGVSGTGISPTDLGTNSIATVAGGLPIIVDSWGQPLTFTYNQTTIPNTSNLPQWTQYQVISSGPNMTFESPGGVIGGDDIGSLSLKN
jgi:prepilin-type N-terminal cleavage/methylation domain-containing protein